MTDVSWGGLASVIRDRYELHALLNIKNCPDKTNWGWKNQGFLRYGCFTGFWKVSRDQDFTEFHEAPKIIFQEFLSYEQISIFLTQKELTTHTKRSSAFIVNDCQISWEFFNDSSKSKKSRWTRNGKPKGKLPFIKLDPLNNATMQQCNYREKKLEVLEIGKSKGIVSLFTSCLQTASIIIDLFLL